MRRMNGVSTTRGPTSTTCLGRCCASSWRAASANRTGAVMCLVLERAQSKAAAMFPRGRADRPGC